MKYGPLSALTGLLLAAGAASASASSITLSYEGRDPLGGVSDSFSLTYAQDWWGIYRVRGDAGAIHMKDQNGTSLITWCLDLFGSLTDDRTYQTTDTPFGDNLIEKYRLNNIQALFDTNYASLDLKDVSQSAGFQIALWELLYEESDTYNVGGRNSRGKKGNFYVDQGNRSAVRKANEYLSNIAKDIAGEIYDLTFYDAGSESGKHWHKDYQDLVSASKIPVNNTPEVPLPATAWLLGGGLAALFGFSRRSKAAKA